MIAIILIQITTNIQKYIILNYLIIMSLTNQISTYSIDARHETERERERTREDISTNSTANVDWPHNGPSLNVSSPIYIIV